MPSLGHRTASCPAARPGGGPHLSDGCRCLVDAAPTHQFIRSLAAVGWPLEEQGRRIGHRDGETFRRVLVRTRIERHTALRVAQLWDRVWDVPGPSPRTVTWASNRGWDAPDPVVVHRLITGQRCPHRQADRDQAVRLLVARGLGESTITVRLNVGISTAPTGRRHPHRFVRPHLAPPRAGARRARGLITPPVHAGRSAATDVPAAPRPPPPLHLQGDPSLWPATPPPPPCSASASCPLSES